MDKNKILSLALDYAENISTLADESLNKKDYRWYEIYMFSAKVFIEFIGEALDKEKNDIKSRS